jgi:hypothetical protein
VKRSYALIGLAVAVAAVVAFSLLGRDSGEDGGAVASARVADGCPEIPTAYAEAPGAVWPSDAAAALVPEFEDLCATPVAPSLFGILNENATYSGAMEAGALGVLHEDGDVLATFTVTRLREGTPGLEDALPAGGATRTSIDGLDLLWGRGGTHVAVTWLDERDVVTITASDETSAARAVSLWLGGSTEVTAPSELPTLVELEPPFEAGPPLDDVPDGYVALELDALAFLQADFADSITIFEDAGIESLGAAVILTDDGDLVATVIAVGGTYQEIGTRPSSFLNTPGAGGPGFVVGGFVGQEIDALIVGHEAGGADEFATQWESAL